MLNITTKETSARPAPLTGHQQQKERKEQKPYKSLIVRNGGKKRIECSWRGVNGGRSSNGARYSLRWPRRIAIRKYSSPRGNSSQWTPKRPRISPGIYLPPCLRPAAVKSFFGSLFTVYEGVAEGSVTRTLGHILTGVISYQVAPGTLWLWLDIYARFALKRSTGKKTTCFYQRGRCSARLEKPGPFIGTWYVKYPTGILIFTNCLK